MKHVTVQIHLVIISMVATQPHKVSPVGTVQWFYFGKITGNATSCIQNFGIYYA